MKSLTVSTHTIKPRVSLRPLSCYHTLRLCRIVKGCGIWTIGTSEYPIEPGDIFLLNNSEYRAIHTVYPPDQLVMEVIDFEPQLVWLNDGGFLGESLLRIFLDRDQNPYGNRLPRSAPVSLEIHDLLDQLAEEAASARPYSSHMSIVKLLNVLVLLQRACYPGDSGGPCPPCSAERIPESMQLIIRHIHEHACDTVTLQQLAKLTHLHPSYISRTFKRYSGLGLNDYTTKLRIKKAVGILRDSDKSVIEIALLCGFNNSSNFYKAFRKITGRTPGVYRKP